MNTPEPSTHGWHEIFHALEAKTKEIQERNHVADEDWDSKPYSEAGRWAVHARRIVDEIGMFMGGS